MADPFEDSGIVYLSSFNFDIEYDDSVDEYLERISWQLVGTVESPLGINHLHQRIHPDTPLHPSYIALQRLYREDPIVRRLIRGLCRERDVERATTAVDHMLKTWVTPDVIPFTNLIAAYCHLGGVDNARIWFDKWVAQGFHPDVILYTTLMNGYCKVHRLQEACKLFAQMKVKGIKPDVKALTVILDGHLKEYLTERGISVDKDIGKIEFKAKFSALAGGLFKYMKVMEIVADKVLYTVLINGHCKIRDIHEACKLFDEMKVSGLVPDAITYTCLVCGYCNLGEIDKAANLLEEMLEKGILPDEPIAFSSFVRANMNSKQLHCNLINTLM